MRNQVEIENCMGSNRRKQHKVNHVTDKGTAVHLDANVVVEAIDITRDMKRANRS